MTRPPRPTPLYHLLGIVSWPLMYGLFRFRQVGGEHLPRDGGYVLAAGHVSNFDPWPLGIGVWPGRFLRFMAKSELFWPPLGSFLRAVGAFRVRRGQADAEAFDTAVRLAREGNVIAMFPEGTRRRKGMRKKYVAQAKTGAARIALEAGVPLVPAGIKGTDRLARLARLAVAYGPPIPLDDLRGLDSAEAARTATDRLMVAIHELEASL